MFSFLLVIIVPGATLALDAINTAAQDLLNGSAALISTLQGLVNTVATVNLILPAALQAPVNIIVTLLNQLVNCLNTPATPTPTIPAVLTPAVLTPAVTTAAVTTPAVTTPAVSIPTPTATPGCQAAINSLAGAIPAVLTAITDIAGAAPAPINTILTGAGNGINSIVTNLTTGTVTDAGAAAASIVQVVNATLAILQNANSLLVAAGVPTAALSTLITDIQALLTLTVNVVICTNAPKDCTSLQQTIGNAVTQIITFVGNSPLIGFSKSQSIAFLRKFRPHLIFN